MDKRKAFYLVYIGVAIFCVFSSGWVSVNIALADQDFTLEELDPDSVPEDLDSSRPGTTGTNAAGQQDTGGIAAQSEPDVFISDSGALDRVSPALAR